MKKESKMNLDDLMDWAADTSDMTDEEVIAELEESGINYKAAMERFERDMLPRLRAARRRQELRAASEERLKHASTRDWLAHVRSFKLSVEELVARIDGYGVAVAHRKLSEPSREDLEIVLADLLLLDDEDKG